MAVLVLVLVLWCSIRINNGNIRVSMSLVNDVVINEILKLNFKFCH